MSARPTPTAYGDRQVYSISDFNLGVHGWIRKLPAVWVEGELHELRRNPNWGHVYLTLKDPGDGSMLHATMPRRRFDELPQPPRAGDSVQALGRAEFVQKKGELRLTVIKLEPAGLGLLFRQIEELRQKLLAEGLFAAERKRPLPLVPRVIGLVCGSDAAAKHDVIRTAEMRYPHARFRIVETVVQGAGAPLRIASALAELDGDPEIDVIVIARGGGSAEDLLPFSSEIVCRAVAGTRTPVVSAVGHEQDEPLVDRVADARAGTPSLAAALIVPDYSAEIDRLDALMVRATRALEAGCGRNRERLAVLAAAPAFADPRTWIVTRRALVDQHALALRRCAVDRLDRDLTKLEHARERLRLLGPAATLERGYAVVQDAAGAVLSDAAATRPGAAVAIRLARGGLQAAVTEVHE